MDIRLTIDRITARLRDGTVIFDDANLLFLKPARKRRRPVVTGIGTNLGIGEDTKVIPVVSKDHFDPELVAMVAGHLAKLGWSGFGPIWKQILAPLVGRLDVSISVEGYETLTPENKRRFVKALPYHSQITWWVAGEEVKY